MENTIIWKDIVIRTEFKPGDIGYIIHLHGDVYAREYGYGISFECYVAEGLNEFYKTYDPATNRVWICEHEGKIIGFLLLLNRGEEAQLRYFLILPEYRGIGLGNKLMNLFVGFLKGRRFRSCYLWTTHELDSAAHLYKKFGFILTDEKESMTFGKLLREQKYELAVGY